MDIAFNETMPPLLALMEKNLRGDYCAGKVCRLSYFIGNIATNYSTMKHEFIVNSTFRVDNASTNLKPMSIPFRYQHLESTPVLLVPPIMFHSLSTIEKVFVISIKNVFTKSSLLLLFELFLTVFFIGIPQF